MILLPDNSFDIKNTKEKGRGLFATKDIDPGVVIGDYLGRVVKTADEDISEADGLYLMYYSDTASIYPTDLSSTGIHLLNHSCTPNCWIYVYKGHTLFFSLREIFKGEELTVSYLLSPDEHCNPCKHICRCNSKLCTGTMHLSKEYFDKWRKFSDLQEKKTKRVPIRYGKELPKLDSYPKSIPDHPIYNMFANSEKPSLKLNNKKLPEISKIRKLIRETGLPLQIPALKTKIFGFQNNEIIHVKTL